MPLPDYSPRSDSFGNWYFGGFQMDNQVEAGYGAATGLTATQSQFDAFLTSAFGASNWARSSTFYYFRPPYANETLTGTVSTSANYRFGNVNGSGQLNTSISGISNITTNVTFPSSLWNSSNCAYAVANSQGIWMLSAAKSTSGTLTTTVSSSYFGWVKDPVFPTNTDDRVRNAIIGSGTNATGSSFIATKAANSTGALTNCFTNSVITCSTSTPGANVTDLCVLDSQTSYLNIGSLPNALFYPGSGLTPGQIYRIPPEQDPDGNTEQNIWLCAEQVYGWNGSAGATNAGYKLIRVWSNNIT